MYFIGVNVTLGKILLEVTDFHLILVQGGGGTFTAL